MRKNETDFENINFFQVCEMLREGRFFIMVFRGADDLMDTYQTILWDNREWIAKWFDSPHGQGGFLIEKNEDTREMLVDYVDELHYNTGYERISHWNDLIMVTFDGDYHVIESTVKQEEREKYAKFFKENHEFVFKNLKFPKL